MTLFYKIGQRKKERKKKKVGVENTTIIAVKYRAESI